MLEENRFGSHTRFYCPGISLVTTQHNCGTNHQTTAMMKVMLDTQVSLSPPCIGMMLSSGCILYNNHAAVPHSCLLSTCLSLIRGNNRHKDMSAALVMELLESSSDPARPRLACWERGMFSLCPPLLQGSIQAAAASHHRAESKRKYIKLIK